MRQDVKPCWVPIKIAYNWFQILILHYVASNFCKNIPNYKFHIKKLIKIILKDLDALMSGKEKMFLL